MTSRARNIERFNPQVLAIEDAQSEIKVFCKQAAEQMYSESAFRRGVINILNELSEILTNEALKERTIPALWKFAYKTYIEQKRLLEAYATYFAVISMAKKEHAKDSDKYYDEFIKTTSYELRQTPVFKSVQINIPDEAYNRALPLSTYHENHMKMVHKMTVKLVNSSAKEDYATNVSLRNIAEMTIRYEYNIGQIEKFKKQGTKLVYIVPHSNCSKRCEKYQVGGSKHPSGLYSLDGTSGKTPEGVDYVPITFATNNKDDIYITHSGRIYQNGCLTGFNCRHTLEAYAPGNKPVPIPADVIARQREIDRVQRLYERRIREAKSAEIINYGVNKSEYISARNLAKKLNDEYIKYSKKHNVAYLPARTKIFDYDIQRYQEKTRFN